MDHFRARTSQTQMSNGTATQTAGTPSAAIISPWVDALCIGGGSILLLLPMALAGNTTILQIRPSVLAWISIFVNLPHFLASYRLVYGSRETVLKYRAAALYVPLGLIIFGVFAVGMSSLTTLYVAFMIVVAGIYLAWHYTGQTWGMMATYAYLGGNPFSDKERLFLRTGLRLLLFWHVSWFIANGNAYPVPPPFHPIVEVISYYLPIVTIAAFVMGLAGFLYQVHRTRKWPPLRVVIPWVAIFFWYRALDLNIQALFWVQIAHAVQYLIFPFRVELNRAQLHLPAAGRKVQWHMLGYTVALIAGSCVLDKLIVPASRNQVISLFGTAAGEAVPMVALAFLNIHHYFTDGCIWKLSNPQVRRDLFGHLTKANPTKAA